MNLIECAVIVAVNSNIHTTQLNRPPAMLPALGKPLVVRMMDRLYRIGIRKYFVIVGENEGEVAAYLSRHWVPNVAIDFVFKLGNTSLIRPLADVARKYQRPFLITTYNCFTHGQFPVTLLNKVQKGDQNGLVLCGAATMLSQPSKPRYALTQGQRVIGIVREASGGKRLLADIAVCGQDFVDYLCAATLGTGSFDKTLADIFQLYLQNGGTAWLAETAWALPIETDYDLLILNRHLLDEEQDAHILSELHPTVQITPPVRIDPQVSIGHGAKIGPHVYLERSSSVGSEAVVRNSMILSNTTIAPNEKVADTIVSTRGRIKR